MYAHWNATQGGVGTSSGARASSSRAPKKKKKGRAVTDDGRVKVSNCIRVSTVDNFVRTPNGVFGWFFSSSDADKEKILRGELTDLQEQLDTEV